MTSNQLQFMANQIAEKNAKVNLMNAYTNEYDAVTRRREQNFSKKTWGIGNAISGVASLIGSFLGW